MIQSDDFVERHTIPRWTSIETAKELGELSSFRQQLNKSTLSEDINEQLEKLLFEWANEPSLPLAIEIISAAKFSDNSTDIQQVLDYAIQALKGIDSPPIFLKSILNLEHEQSSPRPLNSTVFRKQAHIAISKLKRSLSSYPRNPLNWCELARYYLILGQMKQSEKALLIANMLAPNNRTVLRALAHFYSHVHDPEKGLYYLRKSDITIYDPWVLCAEIALSNELQKSSRFIKRGNSLIENKNINPRALSELASELGTMDFASGDKRRGRRKIEIAKLMPHENSVAQMTWINQRVCNIEGILDGIVEPKYNFEAESKWCLLNEQWEKAVETISKWQDYQPFAQAPALAGSFIATDYLGDPNRAIAFLEQGRQSNPKDISILNNYIYSLIMAGRLSDASKQFDYFSFSNADNDEHIFLIATYGLFNFRSGNYDEGRFYYQTAINCAKQFNHPETAYRATIYYAREEKRIGSDITSQLSVLFSDKNKSYYSQYETLVKKFGLQ